MALSPPHSSAPPGILPPSVLSVSYGAGNRGVSGWPKGPGLDQALREAREENQLLRTAISRVNQTIPLFPYIYETATKLIVHGCDADAVEVIVPITAPGKTNHVRDCHGRPEKTVMRIGGAPGVLLIEHSSNLRVHASDCQDIVLSGCEAVELVLGIDPPRVALLACKSCIVVVPRHSWHNAVHSVGCADISIIAVGASDSSSSTSERILLPDMLRTAVRLGKTPPSQLISFLNPFWRNSWLAHVLAPWQAIWRRSVTSPLRTRRLRCPLLQRTSPPASTKAVPRYSRRCSLHHSPLPLNRASNAMAGTSPSNRPAPKLPPHAALARPQSASTSSIAPLGQPQPAPCAPN
jgi:hypothetical protein